MVSEEIRCFYYTDFWTKNQAIPLSLLESVVNLLRKQNIYQHNKQ